MRLAVERPNIPEISAELRQQTPLPEYTLNKDLEVFALENRKVAIQEGNRADRAVAFSDDVRQKFGAE